jgi:hypothetical protein
MVAGIYQIVSKSSRNCYIGSTINIEKISLLKLGKKHSEETKLKMSVSQKLFSERKKLNELNRKNQKSA